MNSVAGNKERLAVSTRGKKYGVSCGGVHAEMRSRGPIGAGVLRYLGTGGGLMAPQLSGAPASPRAAGPCVRGGGSAARLAPGMSSVLGSSLFLHP